VVFEVCRAREAIDVTLAVCIGTLVLGLAIVKFLKVPVQATNPPKAGKVFASGVRAPVRTGVLIKVTACLLLVDVQKE
jgi:hypothetical protein